MHGGLNLLLLTDDAERFRGALMIAMTHQALGGAARLFLQMDAVRLLSPPVVAPRDEAHDRAGFPTLAALLDEALADGVALTACQSGLALAGLAATDLDQRIETGGLASFLAATGDDDRLLTL